MKTLETNGSASDKVVEAAHEVAGLHAVEGERSYYYTLTGFYAGVDFVMASLMNDMYKVEE